MGKGDYFKFFKGHTHLQTDRGSKSKNNLFLRSGKRDMLIEGNNL